MMNDHESHPADGLDSSERYPFDTGIYLVTDPVLCGERGVVETARLAAIGGVSAIQLRDKTASTGDLLEQFLRIADAVAGRAAVIINDRVDVFLAARALGAEVHGVHLGQSDLPAAIARQLIGPDALLGITADTEEHLTAVQALPAGTVDHLGVGAIRATSTKPDHPAELGIEGFAAFAAESALPCFAIGGIGLGDVLPLRQAGAAGVAVVSALCAAEDVRAATERFVERWES